MKIWFSRRKERGIYHLLMKEFLRMTKQQFCFLVEKVLPLYVLPSYGTVFPVILSVAPVLVPLSHLWKLIYLNNIISYCTFYFIFLLLLPWRALKLLYKAAKQQFSPQTPFCNSTLFNHWWNILLPWVIIQKLTSKNFFYPLRDNQCPAQSSYSWVS